MSDYHKFQNSSQFCFECSSWTDYNRNGIGTCTNKDSDCNGCSTAAMHHCNCRAKDDRKPTCQIVLIDQEANTHTAIEQYDETTAWNTAKAIAMEEEERLCETNDSIQVKIIRESQEEKNCILIYDNCGVTLVSIAIMPVPEKEA